MISGLRHLSGGVMPPSMASAAVAITARGQRALMAMPSSLNSSAMPSTQKLMPYLDIVYAVCNWNHRGSRLSGGERVRTCGLDDFLRCGMQACEHRKVPRAV